MAQLETLLNVSSNLSKVSPNLGKLGDENGDTPMFINILDGDQCYKNMAKFTHLLKLDKYKDVVRHVFVGDLYEYIYLYHNRQ